MWWSREGTEASSSGPCLDVRNLAVEGFYPDQKFWPDWDIIQITLRNYPQTDIIR